MVVATTMSVSNVADEVVEHVHDVVGDVVDRARAHALARLGGLAERRLGRRPA